MCEPNDTGPKNYPWPDAEISWHSGFFAAIQMELNKYVDSLKFTDEYQLSKEALIIDVLIIENTDDIKIDKNIGKLFRKFNVCEFKSETDYISISDYYKVLAYGCLYVAFNNISVGELTLTLVEYKRPVKLFKHLRKERGLTVTQPYNDGIYYVMGDLFPVQVIVNNSSLPESEYVFLRNLRSRLTEINLKNIHEAMKDIKDADRRMAYFDTILRANMELMKGVLDMKTVTAQDVEWVKVFTDAFRLLYEKEGWLPDYMVKYREEAEARAEVAEAKAEDAQTARDEAEAKRKEAEIKAQTLELEIKRLKQLLKVEE